MSLSDDRHAQHRDQEVRKLAAVMFTDIAGYSAMVETDETLALQKITVHREHLHVLTKQYHGHIIEFYGDGSLSIFDSVLDAVRCAIHLQQAFRQKGAEVPVRIGIHMGDVIIKERSVFGSGVNIASRIQALGVAGSVLVSHEVQAEVSNHKEIQMTGMGTYHLRNIVHPVRVFAVTNKGLAVPPGRKKFRRTFLWVTAAFLLLLCGAAVYVYIVKVQDPNGSQILREERIAVPPFLDFTGSDDQGVIGRMAAHWITTELIESVHASVVSYEYVLSSMHEDPAFLGMPGAAAKFTKQTGAAHIVKGAYYPVGLRQDSIVFRATIHQIINDKDLNIALPSPTCPVTDPLPCIKELASAITGYWQSKDDRILQPPKLDAYRAYLNAKSVWAKDSDQAAKSLHEAIAIDPEFIDAWFLLLDHYYNTSQHETAADLMHQMRSGFDHLTPRQENYLRYYEADNQGRLAEAFQYLLKEYSYDPADLFVNTSAMTLAAEYLNDPQQVITFFNAIDPDDIDLAYCTYCEVRFSIAIYAYTETGDLNKAQSLAGMLERHATRHATFKRLAEFYSIIGDSVAVDRVIARTQTLDDFDYYRPYLYFVAGRQAQLQGNLSLRDHFSRKSAEMAQPATRTYARAFAQMDSLDRALEEYQNALRASPDDARTLAELGVVLARLGRTEEAEQIIERLIALQQPFDYGNTPYFAGRIAANLGQRERALRWFKQSLDEGAKFRWSVTFAQDSDLMMLHDDPEFRTLVNQRRGG